MRYLWHASLGLLLATFSGMLTEPSWAAAGEPREDNIHLELSPRICTLGAKDKQCQTEVHAQWSASHEESLCLVILDRPDIKRCWEHYSQGTYSIYLTFMDDLTFQLRDPALQNVLASEVLRVIREALHYRHRRRDPWNIFE
ncbi:MAG TPA: DUF3019 domain-containing protein [Steroidobacteraceae bacterium]